MDKKGQNLFGIPVWQLLPYLLILVIVIIIILGKVT